MKFSHGDNGADAELDEIDRHLLVLVQEDCRTAYARLGEQVGLSAPAVLERIKKLEAAGVIEGYHATLDARAVGLDVTAFIGVITDSPDSLARFEEQVLAVDDVLECHHVTGEYTLLLKVKTASTSSLERLISRIRALDGVARTETTVVLSTLSERSTLPLATAAEARNGTHQGKRSRRNGSAAHETHVRRA
jgi:Lrp/AsnC family leucine-responsive transcriptional regulator